MAVRTMIPIFVDEEVMNIGSYDQEEQVESKQKPTSSDFAQPNQLEKLKEELKQAVDNEEYERAAKLRDQIKKIESGS